MGDERPPTVAMVYGFWGQNIGNAFFNVGGKWVLDETFGAGNVLRIQDQPGYRTFHDQRKGNPRNSLDLLAHVKADVIVLQGPMLTETFAALWERTFAALRSRGTRIILLGAALFKYSSAEIEAARRFLRSSRVDAMVTRDADTFEVLQGEVPHAHNGVDSAFFAPDAVRPVDLDLPPYYCLTFDRYPEPAIEVRRGAAPGPTDAPGTASFEWEGAEWTLRRPQVVERFAFAGKAQAYLGHLVDRRRLPDHLDGHLVVRPEHRTNPHVTWKVYQRPNSVASDEPFTYFTVYAGGELTLSDRVHACVATLAYGKPAMLFTPSPRSRLFARLGLDDIRERPVRLDPAYLRAEKQAELAFMGELRAELGI